MSILQNHVYIPFISDTGTIPPESCIFGQLLNVGALFFAITAYVRYRQVQFLQSMVEIKLNKKWNISGLILGILTSIGISIVGNFQETAILFIHMIGACMAFGIGSWYIIIQTRISFYFRHLYRKHPEFNIGRKMLYFRIFLSVCSLILTTIAAIFMVLAMSQFKGKNIACWKEEDGGFIYKVIATFAEWILGFCFLCYILSTTNEYKLIEYEEIRFKTKISNGSVMETKADNNSTL